MANIPGVGAAVAVLQELVDRAFAVEGQGEDTVVATAKGLIKSAETLGVGVADTADMTHDEVLAHAKEIADSAVKMVSTAVNGVQSDAPPPSA